MGNKFEKPKSAVVISVDAVAWRTVTLSRRRRGNFFPLRYYISIFGEVWSVVAYIRFRNKFEKPKSAVVIFVDVVAWRRVTCSRRRRRKTLSFFPKILVT